MKKKSDRGRVLRKQRKLASVIEHNRKYEEERNKYLSVLPKVNSDFEAITQTNLCPEVVGTTYDTVLGNVQVTSTDGNPVGHSVNPDGSITVDEQRFIMSDRNGSMGVVPN